MTAIELFFDPTCPYAWLTSRWATEVGQRIDLSIEWRFLSLAYLNEGSALSDARRRSDAFGLGLLRIMAAVRQEHGNDGVGELYSAVGTRLHAEGASARLWAGEDTGSLVADSLAAAGLAVSFAGASEDPSRDASIRSETRVALARAGDDIGTPVITFDLDRPESSSFFGPIVNRVPRGDEAVELWEALSTVARLPGFSELKRSQRGELDFT